MRRRYLLRALKVVWENCKFWILFNALYSIIIGFVPLVTVWVSRELITSVSDLILHPGTNSTHALLLLLVQFVIILVSSVLGHLQDFVNLRYQYQLDHDLQQIIMKKTTSVPYAYFDMPDFFNHLNRVYSAQGSRFMSPIRNLMDIGKLLISIVSLLVYLSTIHWSLVVLSLLAAVPILMIQVLLGNSKFWLTYSQSPIARDANYASNLLQDRQTAKEIRSFGLSDYLMRRWSEKFLQNNRTTLKLARKSHVANVGLDTLTSLLYAGGAGILIWLIRTTSIRIGDFVAIGQAIQGTQSSINQISMLLARIYEGSFYLQDFFLFLEFEHPLLTHVPGELPCPSPLRQGISFENVTFSYMGKSKPVLENITLHIKPGEKIAIVGTNGSGKTTLVKCLMGLYAITDGNICFDGVDINLIDPNDLQTHMTVIFQDFIRYFYSVHDNIRFGDIHRKDDLERMMEVAATSGVHDFVQHFSNGYETYLGRLLQDGEDLSGGQWQKVALARALFRESSVIVLDEPTAALDPLAEMEVFRLFDHLTHEKTAIFISHRMSAARMANRIVVMNDGRIVEVGTHEELLAQAGEYARMFAMQAQWFE